MYWLYSTIFKWPKITQIVSAALVSTREMFLVYEVRSGPWSVLCSNEEKHILRVLDWYRKTSHIAQIGPEFGGRDDQAG